MASNSYRFVSKWIVEGRIEEPVEILEDVASLPRWWPAVYLAVNVTEPGGAHALGLVADLHTKGWLPYSLRWRMHVTDVDYPHYSRLEASGDFVGVGEWHFEQQASFVAITYDWRIDAEKPLLRYGSALFKPIFAANHRWAMENGVQSLRREIARRRAAVLELTENGNA